MQKHSRSAETESRQYDTDACAIRSPLTPHWFNSCVCPPMLVNSERRLRIEQWRDRGLGASRRTSCSASRSGWVNVRGQTRTSLSRPPVTQKELETNRVLIAPLCNCRTCECAARAYSQYSLFYRNMVTTHIKCRESSRRGGSSTEDDGWRGPRWEDA